jgi:endoglucanase
MQARFIGIALLTTAFVSLGCDSDSGKDNANQTPVCAPGATQLCNCTPTEQKVQTCLPSGTAWSECPCNDTVGTDSNTDTSKGFPTDSTVDTTSATSTDTSRDTDTATDTQPIVVDTGQPLLPCDSFPCVNGTCANTATGYTCTCQTGWSGINCEVNDDNCTPNPCLNGGICQDDINAYVCSCAGGFSGVNCQTAVTGCTEAPCLHGACTDVPATATYQCACDVGWQGVNCDLCAAGYTLENGGCINRKEVPCAVNAVANATPRIVDVTVTWNGIAWSAPATCTFTCNSGFVLENGACINSRQVPCTDAAPTNATSIISNVQIVWIDGAWTVPATCAYTCTPPWAGTNCDVSDICGTCAATETCDGTRCFEPGLIDDFVSCDDDIEEIEGRIGGWWSYFGSSVDCGEAICGGVSTPPWGGTRCASWIFGGLNDWTPPAGTVYAGMGVSLNWDGPLYDACGYEGVEVTYSSDQKIYLVAKWDDIGEDGATSRVTLPATSGIITRTVSLSDYTGLDCAALTEFLIQPTVIDEDTGFGIAVYDIRFTGGEPVLCSDGNTRCDATGNLETCASGVWAAASCPAAQHCDSGRCVADNATPVEINGHLSVSGAHLVNEYGSPVQLKGISTHWLNWEYDGYGLSASALVWMRDNWNLSVIRAAMGTNVDEGYLDTTASRAEMLSQVETVIANAVAAGVYVIVDWHSHEAHEETAEAIAFFEDISSRYGQLPNVLFETYNEPLEVSWTTVLKPYHESVVNAIRAADADANANVVILGTPNWDQDVDDLVSSSARLSGTNIMYTVHFYSCTHDEEYLAKAEAASSAGVPIFVSEWGATDADGGVDGTAVCSSMADEWHSWMDANQISWAAWKLDDCDFEVDENGVADTTCLLALDAPVSGGWDSEYLNGHASYVISKMQ